MYIFTSNLIFVHIVCLEMVLAVLIQRSKKFFEFVYMEVKFMNDISNILFDYGDNELFHFQANAEHTISFYYYLV